MVHTWAGRGPVPVVRPQWGRVTVTGHTSCRQGVCSSACGDAGDTRGGVDLRFVESLVLEQLLDDGVEPVPVLSQQSPGLGVAVVADPAHLLVDGVEHGVGDAGYP